MKIKKSLVALTTASAVALSGSAVAVAADENENTGVAQQEGSLAGLSSEDTDGSSADEVFGWKEETTVLDKIKDIAALFAAIVGIVGTAATLMTTLEKFTK